MEGEAEGDPSPTGGRKRQARPASPEASEGSEEPNKEPRLDPQDESTLRMLAMVPALQGSHRDARGRRRGISISASQLVESGLAARLSEAIAAGRGSGNGDGGGGSSRHGDAEEARAAEQAVVALEEEAEEEEEAFPRPSAEL